MNKIRLGKCFRCIANGGKDPSILRSDYQEWVPDGMRLKVTDKKFIQQRLRESESLDVVVYEFLSAAELLNYTISTDSVSDVAPSGNDAQAAAAQQAQQSSEDELEFYGVPRKVPRKEVALGDEVVLAEESTTDLSIEDEGSPRMSINTGPMSPALTRAGSVRGSTTSPSKADTSPAVTRDLSQVMLDLCLEWSADPENASTMCSLGICDGAITLIDKDSRFNPRENRISFTVELLWNVLEYFLEQAKTDNASQAEDSTRRYLLKHEHMVDLGRAVDVLQGILNYRLHEGYRLSDKELRNEILIILTMLAEFPSAIGCIMRSQVLGLLITYACIEEQGAASWPFFSRHIAKTRNFATSSDIDLEFKKELWFVVSSCLRTNDPDALLCFSSSPLLATMLQYLEHDSFDPHAAHQHHNNEYGGEGDAELQQLTLSMTSIMLNEDSRHLSPHAASKSFAEEKTTGSRQQRGTGAAMLSSSSSALLPSKAQHSFISTLPLSKLRELQLLAVTFLVHNAPKVLGEFERLDGVVKIITLTLKYCRSDVPEHKSLIFNSLILLNRCLINSLSVRQFLNEHNMIQTFLFLFNNSDHEETRAQAVRLISSLCSASNVLCQRQLKALDGIPYLIAPIMRYVRYRKPLAGAKAGVSLTLSHEGEESVQDPLENPFGGEISILVVAILDCFSNAVVGNRAIEAHFADQEGIDTLLDLLETSPFVLRIQVLRLLSNILSNQKLISYVNAWRSPKTLRSAAQVLCHCWLDEEVRLHGERLENGVICDVYHPFGNHQWPAALVNNAPISSDTLNNYSATANGLSPTLNGNGSGFSSPLQEATGFNATLGSTAVTGRNDVTNNGKSVTVTKLATAILAGRNATQTNLPIDVCEQALQKDTRVIIASALQSIGVFEMYAVQDDRNPLKYGGDAAAGAFSKSILQPSVDEGGADVHSPASSVQFQNSPQQQFSEFKSGTFEGNSTASNVFQSSPDLGLTPRDRQVLSMARKYHTLRAGDWWQEVRSHLSGSGVVPIEADAAWIDAHLERAFDAAQAVQLEQMELHDRDQRMKKDGEDGFIDQILVKKQQQIKAEWLKRNAKNKGAAKSKGAKTH